MDINNTLYAFFKEIETASSLPIQEREASFKRLVKKWTRLIGKHCKEDYIKTFRNLNHLKIGIEWLERNCYCEKKENNILVYFLQNLKKYIDVEIKCNELFMASSVKDPAKLRSQKVKIVWTGSKRSLVELIYAINQTTSINGGKVSLKELIGFFSEAFHIELPDFHSVINRMKDRLARSSMQQSRAFFLGELMDEFESKLNFLDE